MWPKNKILTKTKTKKDDPDCIEYASFTGGFTGGSGKEHYPFVIKKNTPKMFQKALVYTF